MPRIFLVNIGANSSHKYRACSPIFPDGTFVYVPFPLPDGEWGSRPYPREAWPFTNGVEWDQTHADPDWPNLTYGDYLGNARAAALRTAGPGDILLFWAQLWRNLGDCWLDFTNECGWYLIGVLRIEETLSAGQSPRHARSANRKRAEANAHFVGPRLERGHVVFLGDRQHSCLFTHAVPFVTGDLKSSLLYRTFRTAGNRPLPLRGTHWSGYVRSCRAVWNLEIADDLRRATLLRTAISRKNAFDLLAGVG